MATELAVGSSRNIRHIAETWFSQRKHLIYNIHRLTPADTISQQVQQLQARCHPVDWYLSNVASSSMFSPHTLAPLHFGVLRVSYLSINRCFLADRTNGRAIATLLCLSSVVVCRL